MLYLSENRGLDQSKLPLSFQSSNNLPDCGADRLFYDEYPGQKSLSHSPQFRRIVTIVVESAALIVLFTTVYTALTFGMPTKAILIDGVYERAMSEMMSLFAPFPLMILHHIYVRNFTSC